jgi:hypothetical protein
MAPPNGIAEGQFIEADVVPLWSGGMLGADAEQG